MRARRKGSPVTADDLFRKPLPLDDAFIGHAVFATQYDERVSVSDFYPRVNAIRIRFDGFMRDDGSRPDIQTGNQNGPSSILEKDSSADFPGCCGRIGVERFIFILIILEKTIRKDEKSIPSLDLSIEIRFAQ